MSPSELFTSVWIGLVVVKVLDVVVVSVVIVAVLVARDNYQQSVLALAFFTRPLKIGRVKDLTYLCVNRVGCREGA